uniref:Uncharacterized protein n=1 Tax=Anguilla anguilla TaxID=7936 RepID=A0A0E9WKS8_ANGAN
MFFINSLKLFTKLKHLSFFKNRIILFIIYTHSLKIQVNPYNMFVFCYIVQYPQIHSHEPITPPPFHLLQVNRLYNIVD